MAKCGIIISRQHQTIGYIENYLAWCVLKRNHSGPHIIETPDGRSFAWEDFPACECSEPDDDRHDCLIYWELGKEKIVKLLSCHFI